MKREARAAGKPDQAIPKIVEGRIEKYLAEHVLYDQEFVNKEKFEGTIGELVGDLATRMGENISVRRFARVAIGE